MNIKRAIAALAAGAPMVIGAGLICMGAFLAFPLVFTVLFWAIGMRLTSLAVRTLV